MNEYLLQVAATLCAIGILFLFVILVGVVTLIFDIRAADRAKNGKGDILS